MRGYLENEPQRIAIFRALQLGDLLVAVPALRAIRIRFPAAEITLIGLPWAASFVQRYRQYIDRFVEFVGYPGIDEVPGDPERTRIFLAEQQRYAYDLAIQMHGSGGTSNPFVLDLKGKVTAGYYEQKMPAGLSIGDVYPQQGHEIWRNLKLAALLGCSHLDPRLEFPLTDEDHSEAVLLLRTLQNARRPWVGLHAGARPAARRWPVEYFAQLADECVRRFGAQIILTGGPDEEATVQQVIEKMEAPALNIAGRTSLGGLAALISKLNLFISNDTGPAHLAHALDNPSIAIFGPADYQRWAALDQSLHPAVRRPVACSPCGYWSCPIDHRCLRGLSPMMVMEVVERFLQPEIVNEERKCND